jgi:hypothetical protein
MNKLPQKSRATLPTINAKFQHEVKALSEECKGILDANASLAERNR